MGQLVFSIGRHQQIAKTQARERNRLIRVLAQTYGWSERQIAAKAGVSAPYVHKILSERPG